MRIEVTPYKVTLEEMELLVNAGNALRPGQLLCLEDDGQEEDATRVYGRVEGLKLTGQKHASGEPLVNMRVSIVLGEPSFRVRQARVLEPADVGEEVERIQDTPEHPIALLNAAGRPLTLDLMNLGTLTLIQGASLAGKWTVLTHLLNSLQEYQRLVIIDPLGIISDWGMAQSVHMIRAGQDAALSLQHIGLKRFLTALSEMLPEIIKSEALQLLAELLPAGQNFYPFKDLLRLEMLTERSTTSGGASRALAMKTPLLNCLYEIDRQRVFADSPRDVFNIQMVLSSPLSVVDLSPLAEPWKTLYYEMVCLELLSNADGDILPVLIYPENYLAELSAIVKKANEADLTLLAIASPYDDPALASLADNRFYSSPLGDWLLEGALTYGLPVQLSLPETSLLPPAEPALAARPDTASGLDESGWIEVDRAEVTAAMPAPPPLPVQSVTPGPVPDLTAQDALQSLYNPPPLPVPPPAPIAPVEVSASGETQDDPHFDSILGSVPETLETEDADADAGDDGGFGFDDDEFHFDLNLDPDQPVSPLPPVSESVPVWEQEPPATHPPSQAPAGLDDEFDDDGFDMDQDTQALGFAPSLERDEPLAGAGPAPELGGEAVLSAPEPPPILHKPVEVVTADSPFQLGDRVESDKYGIGVIQKIIPMESTTAVHVLFDNGVKRTIVPSPTNLKKL